MILNHRRCQPPVPNGISRRNPSNNLNMEICQCKDSECGLRYGDLAYYICIGKRSRLGFFSFSFTPRRFCCTWQNTVVLPTPAVTPYSRLHEYVQRRRGQYEKGNIGDSPISQKSETPTFLSLNKYKINYLTSNSLEPKYICSVPTLSTMVLCLQDYPCGHNIPCRPDIVG